MDNQFVHFIGNNDNHQFLQSFRYLIGNQLEEEDNVLEIHHQRMEKKDPNQNQENHHRNGMGNLVNYIIEKQQDDYDHAYGQERNDSLEEKDDNQNRQKRKKAIDCCHVVLVPIFLFYRMVFPCH